MTKFSKCWEVINSYNAERLSEFIESHCKSCLEPNCPYFGKIGKEIPLRQHTTGIKYDQDKLRLAEMIVDFAPALQELCKVWTFGANKYEKSNWKLVENGKDRYSNALIRHLIAEEDNLYDDESKLLHAAHIAFNALARIYFILEEKKEDGNNN